MTGPEYKSALAALGLTQKAAGEWLGVSEKTAKRYATTGPSGPAARAIEMRLMLEAQPTAWLTPGGDVTRSKAYAVEQSMSDPYRYPVPLYAWA